MKGMHRVKRGKSFEGVVQYVLKPANHHNQPPFVIGGNMSGDQISGLVNEFNITKQIRTDIVKPVWHNSLRLPKGEKLTNTQWVSFADDYMAKMGFSESHMRIYVIHDDTEGQHIHIVASRISLDNGRLYLGQNENLISTRIIEELELKYSLTYTGNKKTSSEKTKIKLSRNEQQKEKRENKPVPKRILQGIIEDILLNTSDIGAFLSKLSDSNIIAVPNITDTGNMSGFSFEYNGIAFKASQIGKDYSWSKLSKKLNYAPERDNYILQNLKNKRTCKLKNDIDNHCETTSLPVPELNIPLKKSDSIHKSPDLYGSNVLRWLSHIPYIGVLLEFLKKRELTLLAPVMPFSSIFKVVSMEINLPAVCAMKEKPNADFEFPSI